MDAAAILVLAVTAATLYLLFTEKATLDVVGLGMMGALVLGGELIRAFDADFDPSAGLLGAHEALANLGNGAVLTVAGLYVLGEALSRTGAVEFIARTLTGATGGRERRIVMVLGLVAGAVSAFLANTAVVLIFVPVILDLARRTRLAASRLLMPLCYATLLGGMCTLVGTSTNLLVSQVAEDDGYEPIGMFEMTPIGAPLLLLGVAGMAVFARRLFPVRRSLSESLGGAEREYVTELVIGPSSPLIGRKYAEAFSDTRAQLLFFVRGEEMNWPPYFDEVIAAGDVVMLRGSVDVIAGLQDALGLKLFNDAKFDTKSMQFFELAVAPHSTMLGREIGELHLFRDFGVVTMAVLRGGHHIRERASKLRLDPGDLLLVIGDSNAQARVRASGEFYLLTGAHNWVVLRNKARTALAIAALVMIGFTAASMAHASRLLPYVSIGGALAAVASGCLTTRRAYRTLDWPVLIFIVGTIGLGQAMTNTGLAGEAAGALVAALDPLGPVAVLGGLSLLCGALTNIISNNAVGVLVTPIAIRAARELAERHPELDASSLVRAFILMVAFSASLSFATHWGHQVNLMIYGPGGYKPSDFLRAGVPITLLCWGALTLGIAAWYGLL